MPQIHYKPAALLAALVLLASGAALIILGPALQAVAVHTVVAMLLFPLILAAMTYFTPVLTRRPSARGLVRGLPWLALVAGTLAAYALAHRPALLAAAALLGLVTVLAFAAWMLREARRALGGPHPGLYWYLAALGCLALGLVTALGAVVWQGHWPALRRLHLHLNLLGFVGLTAIGTLQVLIPTAGGCTDPEAGARLRLDLKYAVAGVLLIAVGSALPAVVALAWLGFALWLVPLGRLAAAVLRCRNKRGFLRGAASPLSAALAGFGLALLSGGLHTARLIEPRASLLLFFVVFLFPLVSGALSYLLPLWWRPQAGAEVQARMRARLTGGSGWRALAFLATGVAILAGFDPAVYLAVAVLGLFLLQVVAALTGPAIFNGRDISS